LEPLQAASVGHPIHVFPEIPWLPFALMAVLRTNANLGLFPLFQFASE
jgi:hypothetical protein